ncbi:uncharacterized protein LOC132197276 isoform X2 [Neocloeon triangulifer]|nr:uncharacterized protein LOC132197276 isoform X2 [Neocloeon triangulifer]
MMVVPHRLILLKMSVQSSSTFILVASLVSGLLCCSENSAAQNIRVDRRDAAAARRTDFSDAYYYRGAQRQRMEERPHHQDPGQESQYDMYGNTDEDENYEYGNEEDNYENQQRPLQKRADYSREPSKMETSASYAQPVKSERSGHYGTYKSGYGSSYTITLQPGAIAITCTVKDPLEHIVWLRSLCPDDYDRGDVVAKGAVSNFPDVFSVSVSGADGEFTSTLSIDKPRSQMGGGVFRCEAWPHHHGEKRHRRQVEGEGRAGRGHHDPWNAIIVGGAEMVNECFYGGGYGDKYRQFRAMGRNVDQSGNMIPMETPKSVGAEIPSQQPSQVPVAPASSNLFPEFGQPDYDELLKLLQVEGSQVPAADLAATDLSPVPQIDDRDQRHAYPEHYQSQYPAYEETRNHGQPVMHYQSRKVNVQSGTGNVRADVELSTGVQVQPSRTAYSRTIEVQGEPEM